MPNVSLLVIWPSPTAIDNNVATTEGHFIGTPFIELIILSAHGLASDPRRYDPWTYHGLNRQGDKGLLISLVSFGLFRNFDATHGARQRCNRCRGCTRPATPCRSRIGLAYWRCSCV